MPSGCFGEIRHQITRERLHACSIKSEELVHGMQLAQISDATGIALYGSAKCTVRNINMITAAGFG